jgi:ABC-type sugar transport system ATPase subunit
MDASTSLVIETHNLSKAYKGVQALKDLHLTVSQHSIFGFLVHLQTGQSVWYSSEYGKDTYICKTTDG